MVQTEFFSRVQSGLLNISRNEAIPFANLWGIFWLGRSIEYLTTSKSSIWMFFTATYLQHLQRKDLFLKVGRWGLFTYKKRHTLGLESYYLWGLGTSGAIVLTRHVKQLRLTNKTPKPWLFFTHVRPQREVWTLISDWSCFSYQWTPFTSDVIVHMKWKRIQLNM